MSEYNNNNKAKPEDVEEYLEIMVDAAKQRSTTEESQRCKEQADCIQTISNTLRDYKVHSLDYMIHTLVSVVVIPIQMLEPDPKEREQAMKDLAIRFVRTLIYMQKRDEEITKNNTIMGQELDKLRNLVKESGIFAPNDDNDDDDDDKDDVPKVQ